MKKCLVCKKNIAENRDICESCVEFLKWKHKEDYKFHIEKLKKYFSKIKFRRAK